MYNFSYTKKTARTVRFGCGFLFILFSFLYLYLFQADLLAWTQHVLARGQTTYSSFWGALLITLVLTLVQTVISRFVVWPSRFYALSFFPSCLLLALCTVYAPAALGAQTTGWSGYAYLAVTLLYLLAARVVLLFPDVNREKTSTFTSLWPNLLLLSVQLCFTGAAGNAHDAFHYELRTARLLEQGERRQALEVGWRSDATNPSLTALRAYALSEGGLLGDKLFEFPQRYGSQGLLPPPSDTLLMGDWPDWLYRHLGGRPSPSLSNRALRFLELLSEREGACPAAGDYLLCAYLLDKQLDKFAQTLPRHYAVNDSLPRYYKEALVLYAHVRTQPVVVFREGAIAANYEGFQDYRAKYACPAERDNRCRDMYGNTYWYYYYFQPLSER